MRRLVKYRSDLNEHARRLRSEMTDCELALWSRLRGKQLMGVQFYRQKPIGEYIVDFYAPRAKLVVEVDGSQHFEAEYARRDAQRNARLNALGLRVIRFNNQEVNENLNGVVQEVLRAVEAATQGKSPLTPL